MTTVTASAVSNTTITAQAHFTVLTAAQHRQDGTGFTEAILRKSS